MDLGGMEFRSAEGRQRYDAVVGVAGRAVVGLDFDGVLSPIVDDPTAAVIHPDGPELLGRLADVVGAVAVITGRPARQVIELGRLEQVADVLAPDRRLLVLGQYGHERWDAGTRAFTSPPPPAGVTRLADELPQILATHDAADAFVEDKTIALAVHTRRLADPAGAFARLLPALTEAAHRHDLAVEPGRFVIEVRKPGTTKGDAVRRLRGELDAAGFVFAGDDLGDIEAFRAVDDLRRGGLPGLLVCSGSEEQQALVELSDLVVDGPAGVLAFLDGLVRDVATGR